MPRPRRSNLSRQSRNARRLRRLKNKKLPVKSAALMATKFPSLSKLKPVTRQTYDLEFTEPYDPLTDDANAVSKTWINIQDNLIDIKEDLVDIKIEAINPEDQQDSNDYDDPNWQDNPQKTGWSGCKSEQTETKKKDVKKRGKHGSDSHSSNSDEDEPVVTKKAVKKRQRSSDSDAEMDTSVEEKYIIECTEDRDQTEGKRKPAKKRGNPSLSSECSSDKHDPVETKETVTKRRMSSDSDDADTGLEGKCEEPAPIEDKVLRNKYEIVQYTEEEMVKNRETKRNGYQYKRLTYKCEMCVLGFTRKENYDDHMEKKHDKKIGEDSCPVCSTRFRSEKTMENHRAKHYTRYRCRLCTFSAAELWSIVTHCRNKHEGDTTESIHCQLCSVVCKSREEMDAHALAAHPLQCALCKETFKGKHTLRSHMRRMHLSKREFTCGVCNLGCVSRSRLETHCASHGGAHALRLAYCALCRVQYKSLQIYRNHKLNSPAHADTAHECPVCHKLLASKSYLKRHVEFFHQKKTKFKCQDCNKFFISAFLQRKHQQTHHGELRPRKYPCDLCSKKFFDSTTLKNHRLTHSTERSFMCSQCGDTFKQRPSLYTHTRLVHPVVKDDTL